ncbi:MAG: hypothetical protein Q8S43_10610 [Actinomycetota bacterium]|nr:MAG: hypothetical protein FD171_1537 [Actinomycetota bacterium]MDP3631384.1 hypothetical protein [Actinomycetota bacterium]
MRFEFGDVDGVTRPLLDFRLFDDHTGVVTLGLVDTGSTHTVLPASFLTAFADTAPQRHISALAIGGYTDMDVPEFNVTLEVVGPREDEILRIDAPIFVTRCELPFAIIGASVLRYLVVVVRTYDGVLHVHPRNAFECSAHAQDALF